MKTAEANNSLYVGKIEIEKSALDLIREKLYAIEIGERTSGRNEVYQAIRELYGAKSHDMVRKIKEHLRRK